MSNANGETESRRLGRRLARNSGFGSAEQNSNAGEPATAEANPFTRLGQSDERKPGIKIKLGTDTHWVSASCTIRIWIFRNPI